MRAKIRFAITVLSLVASGVKAVEFTSLHSFSATNSTALVNADGIGPVAGLLLANDILYGTALKGGAYGDGTVFAFDLGASNFVPLFSFNGTNGQNPYSTLALSGSTLYGTTEYGGNYSAGTVFSLNTNGTGYTNFYNFNESYYPEAGVVIAGNMLYGTTEHGGTGGYPDGVVYSMTTDGADELDLHDFSGPYNGGSDGGNPYDALLLSGEVLYGTTYGGGNGDGTVFAVNTNKTGYKILYAFNGYPDGSEVYGNLVLSGGMLYGTTYSGGNGSGTIFGVSTNGNGFTNLYSFSFSGDDEGGPIGGLVISGSTLYGTASYGGAGRSGAIFAIQTNGTGFTNLYDFTATGGPAGTNSDGAYPYAGLLLSGTTFYGTTQSGGLNGNGTVFALNLAASTPTPIPLVILATNGLAILSWTNAAFVLQSATNVNGPFSSVPGASSPYLNPFTNTQQYFRLAY